MHTNATRTPGASAQPHEHPFFRLPGYPRIFAHRGLVTPEAGESGVLENTRAAFAAALAAGAGYIESDCLLTHDLQVVLVHDSDLLRLFGDQRAIAQVTAHELAELFRDRGGLLTLDEALREFPEAFFNIDVKDTAAAIPAGRLIGQFAPDRVLITSFSDRNRKQALDAATTASGGVRPATSAGKATIVKLLLALTLRSPWLISRVLAGVQALQIPERFGNVRVLSPRLIRAAHDNGVEVHVWTVNDATRMRELAAIGVDGIVTDRTDIAVQTLQK